MTKADTFRMVVDNAVNHYGEQTESKLRDFAAWLDPNAHVTYTNLDGATLLRFDWSDGSVSVI